MLVAHINLTDRGSTGKIALDIMRESHREGIDSTLFTGGYNSHERGAISFQTKFSLRYNQVVARLFDYEDKIARRATKKLITELQRIAPDVIHLHNIHGYYINYELLFDYIKKINVKVVWTLHDCWAFTGHCAYFDRVKCEKWKSGCGECSNLKSYPNSWLFDRSDKLYQAKKTAFSGVKNMTLVCPSKWLANLVKESYLSKYHTVVINNGINLDNFRIVDNGIFDRMIDRAKHILLGVATPFTERKGYHDYIKLSHLVDLDKYQVVMVGVNEEQAKELEKYGIVGIKRTENQVQLAELYSIAHCLLNLTYEDNFPTVNIEALACGCPVVTYNTGGSVEVVDGNNGAVVSQGNVEELARVIESFQIYDRQAISQDAKEKYSSKRMATEYLELYRR